MAEADTPSASDGRKSRVFTGRTTTAKMVSYITEYMLDTLLSTMSSIYGALSLSVA